MRELHCEKDFYWYVKELDLQHRYNHDHIGTPKKYPCKVRSSWEDNPSTAYSARDIYRHEFFYQQEVVCDKCGHKKLVWPKIEEIDYVG